MKRIAIYGRVSTSGQSTDIQLEECRQYAGRCGRERAKARGVKFGRPSKMNSSVAEAVRLLRGKGAGIKDIAKSLEIGVGTVYKALEHVA
jgi:DNA invertase Pin-like site-specific DNA recombinase